MAQPPMVTIEVAQQLWKLNTPFQIILVQADPSTNIDKWWGVNWAGSGLCDVNHGRRGSLGLRKPSRRTVPAALFAVGDKLNADYSYDPATQQTMPRTPTPLPAMLLTGILREIREIREITSDHYQAYDADGQLLMDLNAVTAMRIHKADAFRISMTTL